MCVEQYIYHLSDFASETSVLGRKKVLKNQQLIWQCYKFHIHFLAFLAVFTVFQKKEVYIF